MNDVKHSARGLFRTPGHSVAIIVTLALGIGATTTIYSVVSGVLLRPLPFPDQDRLVMLWQRAPGVGVEEDWFSPAQYFDLREVSGFEEVALFGGSGATLSGTDAGVERVGVLVGSSSLFDVLGLGTIEGRPLLAEDDVPGTKQKAVLSHHLYVQRFGADPGVVGSAITLEGVSIEVVGVLEALPLNAELFPTLRRVPVFDVLLSYPIEDPQTTGHGTENFNVIAKLRAEATASQLDGELLSLAASFAEDERSLGARLEPGSEYRIGVVPLLDQVVGDVRGPLLVLLGATALLLAIACVNVANLLLTRSATRARDLAIRVALGAHRRRVFLQSITESLLLAAVGGVGGIALAAGGVRGLHLLAPVDLPRLEQVGVDGGILMFAAAVCLGSSFLFGVAPAMRSAGVEPVEVLAEAGPVLPARSVWRRRGSGYLVVAQVALSVMLLVGALLLLRTFRGLQGVDPGFEAEGVLSFQFSLSGAEYADPDARRQFVDDLFAELQAQPGVQRAGGVAPLPMSDLYSWTDFAVQGYTEPGTGERVVADEHVATPGYFETMGVPLLAGRGFQSDDGGDRSVVIVDRRFAERFWSVEAAVGKWIAPYPSEQRATVVGVVESIHHYGPGTEPHMTAYFPYRARPVSSPYGVLRGSGDPKEMASVVHEVAAKLDAGMPVYGVRPVAALLRDSLSRERLLAYLLNVFGAVAVVLATVGLYGVLSFAVATHAHELAVRMALGARRRDLYRLVLGRARAVTFAGLGLGVAAALVAADLFEGLVYGVSPLDPLSFAAAVLVVAAVALVASWLPARRASTVDPMTALKRY